MNGLCKICVTLAWVATTVLVGCAEVPTDEVELADRTMERARAAGAADYATGSLQAAQDARDQLATELTAQEEKLAVFRSYDKATELAAASRAAAEHAEQDAVEGRDRAREEAASLIAEVRSNLVEVRDMLDRAPRGKGTEVDLAMLRTDLSEIEKSLTEIDGAFAEERYLEVTSSAKAAAESAQRIEDELQRATEAATKTRTSRRS